MDYGVYLAVLPNLADGQQTQLRMDIAGRLLVSADSFAVATANFTPAASAYGANDVMDTLKEFAFVYSESGARVPGNAGIRITTATIRIDTTALQASEGAYQLQCYASSGASASMADNDAWTLTSADLTAYREMIPLGTPVDLGAALFVTTRSLDRDMRLGAGTDLGGSLWARLQTLAAFTPTAVVRSITLSGIVL